MTKSILKTVFLVAVTVALFSFDTPAGWFKAGSKPKSYEAGIEKGAGPNGTNAATLKSTNPTVDGFGTLMQQCKPGQYSGKRVRMSGFVKSEKVTGWAGLWLRVDQSGSQNPLSFDNMGQRPIKGNTGWTKYEIVLDVPADASLLAYGAMLNGTGQIWFDNLSFEEVSSDVPTTGSVNGKPVELPAAPVNLDFEK